MDALDNDDAVNAGRRIVLPASVYGSPRFNARAFQDAMCIVSRYGKPSLFVTFMCNPDWPAVKSSLFPGETARDRPDLTVRVFDMKLHTLPQGSSQVSGSGQAGCLHCSPRVPETRPSTCTHTTDHG